MAPILSVSGTVLRGGYLFRGGFSYDKVTLNFALGTYSWCTAVEVLRIMIWRSFSKGDCFVPALRLLHLDRQLCWSRVLCCCHGEQPAPHDCLDINTRALEPIFVPGGTSTGVGTPSVVGRPSQKGTTHRRLLELHGSPRTRMNQLRAGCSRLPWT